MKRSITKCKNSTARRFPGEWSIDLWHCKSGIAVVKPRRHYTRRPLYNFFIITHWNNLCAHREPKKGVVIAAEKKTVLFLVQIIPSLFPRNPSCVRVCVCLHFKHCWKHCILCSLFLSLASSPFLAQASTRTASKYQVLHRWWKRTQTYFLPKPLACWCSKSRRRSWKHTMLLFKRKKS